MSAKRADARRARVVQSFTRRFEQKDGEELLAIIGPPVEALDPERPQRPGDDPRPRAR